MTRKTPEAFGQWLRPPRRRRPARHIAAELRIASQDFAVQGHTDLAIRLLHRAAHLEAEADADEKAAAEREREASA